MSEPLSLPRLMVAPTGARRGKSDHPELPVTLDEIVATAVACELAGADGIHLHVRDQDGNHSLDTGLYRETIAAIRSGAPTLFIQATSEAAGIYDANAQQAMVRDLQPVSVSVALREMISGKNDTADAAKFYDWAQDTNVAIQHIVYSPSEFSWLLECIDNGIIPGAHHHLQVVLRSYQGTDEPNPGDLDAYLSLINARRSELSFDWMVCAFGAAETACLAYAVRHGGKARVGFENSLWNADGRLAEDNAVRVKEVHAAIKALPQTLSPVDR